MSIGVEQESGVSRQLSSVEKLENNQKLLKFCWFSEFSCPHILSFHTEMCLWNILIWPTSRPPTTHMTMSHRVTGLSHSSRGLMTQSDTGLAPRPPVTELVTISLRGRGLLARAPLPFSRISTPSNLLASLFSLSVGFMRTEAYELWVSTSGPE